MIRVHICQRVLETGGRDCIDLVQLTKNMASRECVVKPGNQTPRKEIFISRCSATQVVDVCACLEFRYHGALDKDEVRKWHVECEANIPCHHMSKHGSL